MKKKYIKEQYKQLSADAKLLLSAKGARLSLIAAFVFVTASAGAGLIMSYLIINILDYLEFTVTAPFAYSVIGGVWFLLIPPAWGGMRSVASAVCDGREVSLSEIFIAFSSAERIVSAYLGAFFNLLRYAVSVFLFIMPNIVQIAFKLDPDAGYIDIIMYPVAAVSFALTLLWLVFSGRISRLSFFVWSRKMNVFRAFGASVGKKHYVKVFVGEDWLNLLLSAITCFTYFIYQAGPLFALKYELYFRREDEYINKLVKSRKDGQKQ